MYIGAWLPFDSFTIPDLGINPSRLVILSVGIMLLRRIPAILALYRWVPEIASWKEALFSGHFGVYILTLILHDSTDYCTGPVSVFFFNSHIHSWQVDGCWCYIHLYLSHPSSPFSSRSTSDPTGLSEPQSTTYRLLHRSFVNYRP